MPLLYTFEPTLSQLNYVYNIASYYYTYYTYYYTYVINLLCFIFNLPLLKFYHDTLLTVQ